MLYLAAINIFFYTDATTITVFNKMEIVKTLIDLVHLEYEHTIMKYGEEHEEGYCCSLQRDMFYPFGYNHLPL